MVKAGRKGASQRQFLLYSVTEGTSHCQPPLFARFSRVLSLSCAAYQTLIPARPGDRPHHPEIRSLTSIATVGQACARMTPAAHDVGWTGRKSKQDWPAS